MARKVLNSVSYTKIIIYYWKIQLIKAISSRLGYRVYFTNITNKEEKDEIIRN